MWFQYVAVCFSGSSLHAFLGVNWEFEFTTSFIFYLPHPFTKASQQHAKFDLQCDTVFTPRLTTRPRYLAIRHRSLVPPL